jgi:hypothetical protein
MRTLLIVDVPLCIGATGSLAMFYGMAEKARGQSAWNAIVRLPALIALGTGLAPHLTSAVFEGLTSMAGEFVRTPKRGEARGRYRQVSKLPFVEALLSAVSATSAVVAFQTGHYLAMPFAALFALGYLYVAVRVACEQLGVLGTEVPAPLAEAAEAEVPTVPNAA